MLNDNEDDELLKAYIIAHKNNNSRSNERSNETDTLDTSFSTQPTTYF
jgi:hypothetical protein